MANLRLALVADETRYHGWTRIGFHGLLILGIFLLIFSAYVPWFLYPTTAADIPFKTYVGPVLRDGLSVVLQYYVLVFVFTHYVHKPVLLVIGLIVYYVVLFTFYYFSAFIVKDYFGLPDDYSGSITHFERHSYWEALRHSATFFHLLFIIERAFYPLAIKLLVEVYRRQLRNARLQQQYTQLELNFLKSQINPHFLFNVLNSIYALTEEASPRAALLVEQLSVMMRYSLYETAETYVSLQKELQFIRDYVALEQTRTLKRLTLQLELPDVMNESLEIAPFILITFVENAFKHGVESTSKKAWMHIAVQVEGTNLRLMVANSKPLTEPSKPGGLGLANVQRRLSLLYPGHELLIDSKVDSYTVNLILPLR
ncbi:sensor histidine kinase [Spirosoma jeollabukense]